MKEDFYSLFDGHVEKSKLKNYQIADKIGKTPVYIGQLRKGKVIPPKYDLCNKLADILGLSEDDRHELLKQAYWERCSEDDRKYIRQIEKRFKNLWMSQGDP